MVFLLLGNILPRPEETVTYLRLWAIWVETLQGHIYHPLGTLSQGTITDLDNRQFIFHVQAGVQWSRRIKCLNADVFTRVAVEYQRWTADDPLPYVFSQTVNATTVSGGSLSPDIDFTGLAWSIGFAR